MSLVTVRNFDMEISVNLVRDFNSFSKYAPYYKVLTPCDNKMIDILIPLKGIFLRHISVRWI